MTAMDHSEDKDQDFVLEADPDAYTPPAIELIWEITGQLGPAPSP